MSKKIRSQYIKNLVADKEALAEQLKENTKDSLRSLLEDTVKDSLRDILKEDDDKEKEEENSFEVEEVGTEQNEEPTEETSEISVDTDSADTESGDDTEDITISDDTEVTEEPSEGEDMWKELDKFKTDDGEFDLTGMGAEDAIKVLKVMSPEDGIRIVKNNDGSIKLSDDETEKEYIIDIEGTLTDDTNKASDEVTAEIEIAPLQEELGYTDNYQNQTAMTTPDNDEPGENVVDADKGVPHGTEKPWVGNEGNVAPYEENVNEDENECGDNCLYEIEIDTEDEASIEEQSRFGKANEKGMHKTPKSSNDSTIYGAHVISREGEYTGTETGNNVNENLRRKAEVIFNENKELRKIAEDLRAKINEAVVINSSLAKVINLVTENSTTRNEKIDILQRFNNVKTINESKELYETISRELKNAHTVNNSSKLINGQLNESKIKATETQIYKSDDLDETRAFMKRLDAIK